MEMAQLPLKILYCLQGECRKLHETQNFDKMVKGRK